jgi:hypothetical protein
MKWANRLDFFGGSSDDFRTFGVQRVQLFFAIRSVVKVIIAKHRPFSGSPPMQHQSRGR